MIILFLTNSINPRLYRYQDILHMGQTPANLKNQLTQVIGPLCCMIYSTGSYIKLNPPSTKEFFFEFFNHFWIQYSPRPPKTNPEKKIFFFKRKYPFRVWTKKTGWYLQGYGSPTFLFMNIFASNFYTAYMEISRYRIYKRKSLDQPLHC